MQGDGVAELLEFSDQVALSCFGVVALVEVVGAELLVGAVVVKQDNRVMSYLLLLRDEFPSTDEEQSVHLDVPYPDVRSDLNRWMPLVKWFLAIPHYVALLVLDIAVVLGAIVAWIAILFTGHYPRRLFDFMVGVMPWHNRVVGYAFALATDRYPPFRLAA